MAGKQLSYDYLNQKRDLSDAFLQVIQKAPVVRALLGDMSVEATNKKHEWLEDVVSPKAWTVNATRNLAGAKLTLVTTAAIEVGMVLGFETAAGVSKTVQLEVTAIDSGTVLSVSVYGGTTDVQLVATDAVFLVGKPKNESTSPDPNDGYEPTTEYNYTQIFDRTAKVSKTAEFETKYGLLQKTLDYQISRHLLDMGYEMNNAMIYGTRVERDLTNPGSMGGLLSYLENGTGNQIDAASAALTTGLLNDAFETGTGNGADNLSTILCNSNQARKISAFNTSGNNPVVMRDDNRAGNYVLEFVSDLPIAGGLISRVVVDRNFPKDKIAIIDTSRIGLVPMSGRNFSDENAAGNGDDFFAKRVLGEFTMQMKNASESHMLIHTLLP
jgi:hypothetical protein